LRRFGPVAALQFFGVAATAGPLPPSRCCSSELGLAAVRANCLEVDVDVKAAASTGQRPTAIAKFFSSSVRFLPGGFRRSSGWPLSASQIFTIARSGAVCQTRTVLLDFQSLADSLQSSITSVGLDVRRTRRVDAAANWIGFSISKDESMAKPKLKQHHIKRDW